MPVPYRRPHRLSQATAALALATLLAAPAAAQTYDARADYSTTSNPNGVWTYGYATALGSAGTPAAVTTYTTAQTYASGLHSWYTAGMCGDNTPAVYKNLTASGYVAGSANVGAGQLALHPGCRNEFSVLRFTAPTAGFTAGSFDVAATFRSGDVGSKSVALLRNGSLLFEDLLSGGESVGYSTRLGLVAGDVIDLMVGADGDYRFDTLEANLVVSAAAPVPTSPVPEPATWALLATGLGAIGLVRRRRAAAG
jgi:hypothetical protein